MSRNRISGLVLLAVMALGLPRQGEATPTGDSVVFAGDRARVGAPKTGVVLRFAPTASTYGGGSNRVDCWLVKYDSGDFILGFDYVAGQHDATGTWSADFYIV